MRQNSSIAFIALLAMLGTQAACAQRQDASAQGQSHGARDFKVFNPADLVNYVKPSNTELRTWLTPLEYDVTQNEATETPFANPLWDQHEAGIYVDIVSGEPLFSSLDKYDSGTGWPSFTRPLVKDNLYTKIDSFLGYERTEVRSQHADSHLGHIFPDGPRPTGLRYCINSASLRFVPVAELEKAGYGAFKAAFTK